MGVDMSLRFVIASLVVVVVLVSSAAVPSYSVMFGEVDSNDKYPYVGLVVFYDENLVPLWRCSGALITATSEWEGKVFLTAGHCAGFDPDLGKAPSRAQIWFNVGPIERDPTWEPGESCIPNEPGEFTRYPCAGGYWGTPFAHPEWTGYLTIPNTHDVGVVILDEVVSLPKYGKLAGLHYLDTLATRRGLQNVKFTVVGYGLQMVKPHLLAERTRYVATVSLVDLRSALNDGYNIQFTSAPGEGVGPGGVCFGDSGGPVIHKSDNGEVIVAVNSFVLNENCMGTAFSFRVDTEEAWELLAQYLK
jgi:hypothetical protein